MFGVTSEGTPVGAGLIGAGSILRSIGWGLYAEDVTGSDPLTLRSIEDSLNALNFNFNFNLTDGFELEEGSEFQLSDVTHEFEMWLGQYIFSHTTNSSQIIGRRKRRE